MFPPRVHAESEVSLRYGHFLLGYVLLLGGVGALSFAVEAATGIQSVCVGVVLIGVLFLLAPIRETGLLFKILRNIGWLALIQEPSLIRLALVALGIFTLILGVAICVPSQ